MNVGFEKFTLTKIVIIIFVIFFVFIILALLGIVLKEDASNNQIINRLPDFLGYLTSNPLVSAVFAGLILFLTAGAFQSSSERISKIDDRISQLDSKIDDNVTRNSKSIEEMVKRETKEIYDKADFLYEEVREIEERHEWLRLFSQDKLFFDVPTTIAIFEDTLRLIQSGNRQYAYVWLFNSIENDYFGDERSSLDLALLAIIFYDDVQLALRILEKVQKNHERVRHQTLLYFTIVALRSNSIPAHNDIYRTLEGIIIPAFPFSFSQLKKILLLSRSERIARRIIRKNADAYASLAIFFAAMGELEKLPILKQKALRYKICFDDIPFSDRIFENDNTNFFQSREAIGNISSKVNPSRLDMRIDFLDALYLDDTDEGLRLAKNIHKSIVSQTAYERRDRAFRTWFETIGVELIAEREIV